MRMAGAVLMALAPLWAQEIKFPASLDALSAKAEESVDVTVDKPMLQLAARLISEEGDKEAKIKKLIAGLDSIYVRSLQFAGEGAYSQADVDAVRTQLRTPTWTRLVGVHSKRRDAHVDIYCKTAGDGTVGGIVVLSAEPRELTIVSIVGQLDPTRLGDLSGQFHIPPLDLDASTSPRREPQ